MFILSSKPKAWSDRFRQSVLGTVILGAMVGHSHLHKQEDIDPEQARQQRLTGLFNKIRFAQIDIEKTIKSVSEVENLPHAPKDVEKVLTSLETQLKSAAGLLEDIVKNAASLDKAFNPRYCRDMMVYIASKDVNPERLTELANTKPLTDLSNAYSSLDARARKLVGQPASSVWNTLLTELDETESLYRHALNMHKKKIDKDAPEFKQLSTDALVLHQMFDWTYHGCQDAFLKAKPAKASTITVTPP